MEDYNGFNNQLTAQKQDWRLNKDAKMWVDQNTGEAVQATCVYVEPGGQCLSAAEVERRRKYGKMMQERLGNAQNEQIKKEIRTEQKRILGPYVYVMMELQGGSITVASAEGGVFDSIAGRYDRAANFDIYLKGHAGDTISVDRIGRKSNYIAKPRLTMILTIQPAVLYGLMDNATFRGRGLCGRFLYVICKSKVGHREVSPAPISSKAKQEYRDFVRRILADQGGGTVHLSPDANEQRERYQEYIEKKLGSKWEHMRDWGSKLVGAMVRIAALLHLSSFPADVPISVETLTAAIRIAEFLSIHAEAAYQAMGADESVEDAKYLWRRIADNGEPEISKRDLFRLVRGKFKKAECMEAPLRVLMEYGYIRIEDVERDGAGRKSSPKIKVNPLAYGHNGQNGHN